MKQFLLLAIVLLYFQSLFAQIPAGYYDDASGKTGNTLKTALHNIIDDHNAGSYDLLWTILPESDEDPTNTNNFILLYTGRSIPKATSAYPDYNREHVWAKSHGNFGTNPPAGTDAHHLRPTDVSVNSDRGNKDFDNGGSYHTEATECRWDDDSWEPRDAVKGDVARMMFYMVVRYEGDVSGEPDLELVDYITGSTTSPIFGKLSTLLEWHNSDPVDDIERHRNEIVYSYQYNRNPFIDHPEYVCQIWGGNCGGVPSITDVVINPSFPTSSDVVNFTATITDSDGTIANAKLYWGLSASSLTNTINMSVVSGDSYQTNNGIPAQADGAIVYYEIEVIDNDGEVTTTSVKSYTVDDNPTIKILNEDFSTCPATGWTTYSVSGSENWSCGTEFMEVNAYGSDAVCDDWLISPSIDLNAYENEILSFKSWTKYEDAVHPIEVQYSVDYSGTGDPSSSTWSTLSATWSTANSETWTSSGDIDISNISGSSVYFAFKYISTGTGGGTSAWWEIDDVLITGEAGSSNAAPQISNIQRTPSSPTLDTDVTITATITDSDGIISSAKIKWGTSSGVYSNEVTMTKPGSDYSGVIPAQSTGTSVYFVIEASDNEAKSSTSIERSYTVEGGSSSSEIFFEDFETATENEVISINGWTTYSQVGTRKWEGRLYNSNKYAQMSAYSSTEVSNITWMITPSIDLTNFVTATFSFKSKDGHNNGDPLEVFISTNYSGTGDPTAAVWTKLNPTIATGTTSGYATNFTTSGDVSIDSYCGESIYISYKYSGGDPSLTTTIQIDDVLITGVEGSSNSSPEITGISNTPTDPGSDENVTVSATITDSDGTITLAKVKWGTSTGVYSNEVNMGNSGDVYSGVIPKQTGGTTVYYIIEATDNDAAVKQSSESNYNVSEVNSIIDVKSTDIQIYPNPTQGLLFIQTKERYVIESIKVFNLIGEKFIEFDHVNSNRKELNMEGLYKGIYLVQVKGNGFALSKKIMLH